MERAGNSNARVPRYYAQLCESPSVEDVDVAGASVKRTRIDDSVLESLHVDAEGSARTSHCDSDIGTISSAEQTIAPIELDLATPPAFTAPTTTNDVTTGGGRYRLNQCPREVKEGGSDIRFSFPHNVPELFSDHFVHRTVFQITRNDTTLVQDFDFRFLLGFCSGNITNPSSFLHPRCLVRHFQPQLAAILPSSHQAYCCPHFPLQSSHRH
jgi:hypothetical protein